MVYVGEIVIFHDGGLDRPAVVTRVWTKELVNLFVFQDGTYDYGRRDFEPCQTSILKGEQLYQWSPIGREVSGTLEETGFTASE